MDKKVVEIEMDDIANTVDFITTVYDNALKSTTSREEAVMFTKNYIMELVYKDRLKDLGSDFGIVSEQ